jgi:hypothetical protein
MVGNNVLPAEPRLSNEAGGSGACRSDLPVRRRRAFTQVERTPPVAGRAKTVM